MGFKSHHRNARQDYNSVMIANRTVENVREFKHFEQQQQQQRRRLFFFRRASTRALASPFITFLDLAQRRAKLGRTLLDA